MVEKGTLTNRSKTLLKGVVERLEQETRQKALDFGEAVGTADGDGYHDETVSVLEQQSLMAQARLAMFRLILENATRLYPPEQFETVELGHRVTIRLLDDLETDFPIKVTVLSSNDVLILSDEYDQDSNLPVSDKSPLGEALIGSKVGQTVSYSVKQKKFRMTVLEIELANEVFN